MLDGQRDELIGEFCEMTGVEIEKARFYLEANNWQLQLALQMQTFFDNDRDAKTVKDLAQGSADSDMEVAAEFERAIGDTREKEKSPSTQVSTFEALEPDQVFPTGGGGSYFHDEQEVVEEPNSNPVVGPVTTWYWQSGKSFAGKGHNNHQSQHTPKPSVARDAGQPTKQDKGPTVGEKLTVRAALSITNIIFRLADGSRLEARFNLNQTVNDLHDYLNAYATNFAKARPQYASLNYVLTVFPNTELIDKSQTIKSAKLFNTALIVKVK